MLDSVLWTERGVDTTGHHLTPPESFHVSPVKPGIWLQESLITVINHLQNKKEQELPGFSGFSLSVYLAQGIVLCCKKALSIVLSWTVSHC